MKIAIRMFAFSVALAGLVSSSFAPAAVHAVPSHIAAVSMGPGPLTLPVPICGPGVPGCGQHLAPASQK